jgi:hypothetical protein
MAACLELARKDEVRENVIANFQDQIQALYSLKVFISNLIMKVLLSG